jgi:hypothetical protein
MQEGDGRSVTEIRILHEMLPFVHELRQVMRPIRRYPACE